MPNGAEIIKTTIDEFQKEMQKKRMHPKHMKASKKIISH